jgi:hypothetical protein
MTPIDNTDGLILLVGTFGMGILSFFLINTSYVDVQVIGALVGCGALWWGAGLLAWLLLKLKETKE